MDKMGRMMPQQQQQHLMEKEKGIWLLTSNSILTFPCGPEEYWLLTQDQQYQTMSDAKIEDPKKNVGNW